MSRNGRNGNRGGRTVLASLFACAVLGPARSQALPKTPKQTETPAQKKQTKQRKLVKVMPVPCYPVLKVDKGHITVDGSLAEWPKTLPAINLNDPRQLSGTAHGAWKGERDLNARGGMVWDEDAIYLSLLIMDDWPRPLPKEAPIAGAYLPPCDNVELSFDPLRNTRSAGRDPGREEDREYTFGMMHDKRTFTVCWTRLRGIRQGDTKAHAVLLYDVKNRRWTLEARIPWKDFLPSKMEAKEGSHLDCKIILNDLDAVTDPLAQTRIGWTFGTHPTRIDPAVFGTLYLAGKTWNSSQAPKRPPLPKTSGTGQPPRSWFEKLYAQFDGLQIEEGRAGVSGERGRLLDQIDQHLSEYPTLDAQQLLYLMQRRMQRELAGYMAQGAPYYLERSLIGLYRKLASSKRTKRIEVIALPGRGWLVRSPEGYIAISPSFPSLELVEPLVGAVFYPHAIDPLDRQDPLSFRMLAKNKRVLAHLAFHLHGGGFFTEDLVKPGETEMVIETVKAHFLGRVGKDGAVTPMAGIQLTWKSGFVLVAPSLSGLPDQLELPKDKKNIDVLLLDPDHPSFDAWIDQTKPKVVLLEGFLDLPRFRGGTRPRTHRIAEARDVLRRLEKKGVKAYLLGPGQRWPVR